MDDDHKSIDTESASLHTALKQAAERGKVSARVFIQVKILTKRSQVI
jgi:hypothetical protein